MGKKPEQPAPGAPAWMATFSDLMTQLLVFFIFLFTMSSIDSSKARTAFISFRGAIGGPLDVSGDGIITSQVYFVPYPETSSIRRKGRSGEDFSKDQLEYALDEIVYWSNTNSKEDTIATQLNLTQGSIEINLKESLLFDPGLAELKKDSIPIIVKLAKILRKLGNKIIIEGHTDDIPITRGKYRSNWELSSARALNVAHVVIDKGKIPAHKVSITGYAEHKPISPNVSAINRAKNRRVTIVVVKKHENELY